MRRCGANWPRDAYLLHGLGIPAVHDLRTDFATLFEAVELHGTTVRATHRARELVTFTFDRGLPAFLRSLQR